MSWRVTPGNPPAVVPAKRVFTGKKSLTANNFEIHLLEGILKKSGLPNTRSLRYSLRP
jgi:hypothetical protein